MAQCRVCGLVRDFVGRLFGRPAPAVSRSPVDTEAARETNAKPGGAATPVASTTGVEALLQKAQGLLAAGQLAEAVTAYRSVLALDPSLAEGHYKLGNACNRLGRWSEALASYDQAVALDPEYANAFCNRGTVLERLERWNEALASYDRALALNPKDAFAYYNRAGVLRELQRLEDAVASYQQAIALNNEYVEAYVNLGHLLLGLTRHKQAAESYSRAIELSPFPKQGAAVGVAVTLRPEQRFLIGMKRQALALICDWDDMKADLAQIEAGLRQQLPVTLPLAALVTLSDPVLLRAVSEIWIREESPPDPSLGPIVPRPRSGKIRVGYFSADFRAHPVAYLTAGLFEQHDRSRFEVIAFAFGPETNDPMQIRMSKAFDRFIDVRQRTDVEVAALARELGIDIAVNLNGITEHSRSKIFALRAAPLQINYLGYPGTLGAPFLDYIIADAMVIPRARQQDYAEKVIYLPDSFMPFDSSYAIADRKFTRQELGLPDTAFVYCCFNGSIKITPEVFDVWMRLLARHENSVLWLSHTNAGAVDNLRKEAERRGVDARRLVFATRLDSLPAHLARIRAADIFLDTFPYNAHSTALDALWAGVPVLTYAGECFASRVAASLLSALGLSELITYSLTDYEKLAVSLTNDPQRLGKIRATLEQNRLATSLFDTAVYARKLEAVYETIYERHLSEAGPAHINEHLAG